VASDPRRERSFDPRLAAEEPLQARGPDPREEPPPGDLFQEPHGKAAGGPHHDKTPPVLAKQTKKHRQLEKGRWKDTGRAGA
jgi:hypothetical protein